MRISINAAIRRVSGHGHRSFVTPEGLLLMSQSVNTSGISTPDDRVFDEMETLPVRAYDNSINLPALNKWLGY